jgi:hypothetical protein
MHTPTAPVCDVLVKALAVGGLCDSPAGHQASNNSVCVGEGGGTSGYYHRWALPSTLNETACCAATALSHVRHVQLLYSPTHEVAFVLYGTTGAAPISTSIGIYCLQ